LATLVLLLANSKPKKEQDFNITDALAKRKPLRKTSTAVMIDGAFNSQPYCPNMSHCSTLLLCPTYSSCRWTWWHPEKKI